MSDEAPVPPQFDASRVMFNGAAIGLVTSLTGEMEKRLVVEIKAAEVRQNDKLDNAVAALTGDVDALEAWREATEDARLLRQGQLSVITGLGRFVARYDKAILGMGATILAAVLAAIVGIRVG